MPAAPHAPVLGAAMDAVNAVTDRLDDWSSRWWFIALIFLIAYLDSIVPVVPSETAVIIGGVAAGQGNQQIAVVIAAAATGAFLGDSTAYLVGARLRGLVQRRAARHPAYQRRLDWAARQIRTRGGMLLLTARFVPGGRTALTISSGVTHQPFGWFARWIAFAVVCWAAYASLLGYVFGNTFKDDHTKAFLIAFGCALGLTVVMEIVRFVRERRKPDRAAA